MITATRFPQTDIFLGKESCKTHSAGKSPDKISSTVSGVGLSTLPLSYNYLTLVCAILFMGLFMGKILGVCRLW